MEQREVATLWFSLAEQEWDPDLHAALATSGCLTDLAVHDEQVLTAAAHAAMARGRSLTRQRWERCVDGVREQSLARWRTSPSVSERALDLERYRRVSCLVDRLDAATSAFLDDLARRFGRQRVDRVRAELLDRVVVRADVPAGPPPAHPAAETVPDSLPALAVDADELVVVHLLALSPWACRFSYDADGRAFAGRSRHQPSAERVRVDGLSAVLDWTGGLVRAAGGCAEVVVHGERVRCAHHVRDLGRLLVPGPATD